MRRASGAGLVLALALGCAEPASAPAPALSAAAAVLARVRADPSQAAALCPGLEAGLRAQCEDIGRRPHLGTVAPRPGAVQTAVPSGVGSVRSLLQDQPPPGPWPAAVAVDCSAAVDRSDCVEGAARRRVLLGDTDGALARCAGLPAGNARDDCAFRAAEVLTMAPARPRVADVSRAAGLCLWAGPFAADCLRHLAGDIGRLAPIGTGTADWRALDRRADALAAALPGPVGAAAASLARAQGAWLHVDAHAAACAAGGAAPDELGPHLRAAVAWRLAEDGLLDAVLDDAVDAVLAGTAPASCAPRAVPRRAYDVEGRWSTLRPGEADLPRVALLGEAARVVAEAPAVDAAVAVLEVAARHPRAPAALLDAGLAHPDWRVRWTAARLRQEAGAPAPRGAETHPIVAGRLR